jgi:multidrug efflux system outer membrane protein
MRPPFWSAALKCRPAAAHAWTTARRPTLLVLGVCSAMLAGCTVGPNYQRPEMPSPDQYRFVDSPQQATSLADAPWFQVFDDPALQALIKDAIASNLDLRAAVARVEEARARAGIAKSYYYPQVDGQFTAALRGASGDNNAESSESVTEGAAYGFRLSWEIDLFGRLRRQREAALALVLASEQARRGVLVTLVGDVASNYFLLRELDLQLDIARRTLKVSDDTVAYFRNRLDGGVSNRLEVDRIVAFRAETAASIPEIERQIGVAENGLSLLLGRPPGAITRQTLRMDEAQPPPIPPGLPTSLLERRPDVAMAEQLLVAANADIGQAKALFFPTISLTGFLGGVSGDLTSFLGGGGAVWSLSPGLFQPIFQAGRLQRNVEAMQARFDAALAGYQKAALNGYREVANALVTIQKLAEIRTQQEIGVVALRDAADLARARYDSGLASYIEILTADQELFSRELLLAQTTGSELRARAELYRALGGGWQPQP